MNIRSSAWAVLFAVVIDVLAPVAARADEAALRARIAELEQQNAALQARLGACEAGRAGADVDADVIALMRKLGMQQSDAAERALGFGGAPLILPEALLRSVVPGEFIVVLAQGAPRPRTALEAATAFGLSAAQVLHVYDQALAGFAVRLSAAERDRLEALPGIAGIARNGRVFSTGVRGRRNAALSAPYVQRTAAQGRAIEVYLFDTGIRRAHRDLQGRVRPAGFSFFDNGIAGEDCAGHGTHVAARIAGNRLGVSRAAQLTSVKVIDRFGTGDVATVIAGIDWVMAQPGAAKLVNMSLTRMVTEEPAPLDLAVEALIESGAVVVVAAGNAAADASGFTPARIAGAITVGSVGSDGVSAFSNAGQGVDIYAPGEKISSASIRDICAVHEMSGTSMAAPYVTGVVADLMAQGIAPQALEAALRAGARRVSTGAFAGETERYVMEPDRAAPAALCPDP